MRVGSLHFHCPFVHCFVNHSQFVMLALQSCSSNINQPQIQLVQSKIFKVLDLCEQTTDVEHRSIDSYRISGYQTDNNVNFLKNMRLHGLCTCSNLVSPENRTHAFKSLQSIVKRLIASYDEVDDEFCDIDQEALHIVRRPRIGRGKHNIHFDPLESPQHAALEKLAADSHFSGLLSKYMGAHCSLRESGISITRPYQARRVSTNGTQTGAMDKNDNVEGSEQEEEMEDPQAGEGMEWHSDGARGEATILMALEDVEPEQGSLCVIPGSHKIYVDGIGHTEVWYPNRMFPHFPTLSNILFLRTYRYSSRSTKINWPRSRSRTTTGLASR